MKGLVNQQVWLCGRKIFQQICHLLKAWVLLFGTKLMLTMSTILSVTCQPRTVFLVFLDCFLIFQMSKKQTSVESNSFGSEFIAIKQCCEYIWGLCYKIKMMDIPVDSLACILSNNQSVLANTTILKSTLKKKSLSITYHFVKESSEQDK